MCAVFHVIMADVASAKQTDLCEVNIKKHKYNFMQGLLEKWKSAQHV
jgi:hypothetical protein